MYKVSVDKRIQKKLYRFSKSDRARITRLVKLFSEKGFSLSEVYLKKISKKIWELRPAKVRLLFGLIGNEAIIVNVFKKKTAKTPLKEIKLAEKRIAYYL